MSPRRALGLVLAAALVLGIWGLRWGLPSEFGWAPDEVLPADVDAAVAQRFAHGWHTKYPPLHSRWRRRGARSGGAGTWVPAVREPLRHRGVDVRGSTSSGAQPNSLGRPQRRPQAPGASSRRHQPPAAVAGSSRVSSGRAGLEREHAIAAVVEAGHLAQLAREAGQVALDARPLVGPVAAAVQDHVAHAVRARSASRAVADGKGRTALRSAT